MKYIRLVMTLVLVAAFVTFVLQNLGDTTVHFLTWDGSSSLALPLIAVYVLGGLTARPLFRYMNSQRKSRKLEKNAVKAVEKKIKEQGSTSTEA